LRLLDNDITYLCSSFIYFYFYLYTLFLIYFIQIYNFYFIFYLISMHVEIQFKNYTSAAKSIKLHMSNRHPLQLLVQQIITNYM